MYIIKPFRQTNTKQCCLVKRLYCSQSDSRCVLWGLICQNWLILYGKLLCFDNSLDIDALIFDIMWNGAHYITFSTFLILSIYSFSTTSTYLYISDRQIIPTVTPCWSLWTFVRFMTNSQKRKEDWRSCMEKVPIIPSSL